MEVGDEAAGQHSDAVFHAFAVANDDLLLGKVEVFDSEGEGFAHAHSGAVEELNEKAVCSVHLGDDRANFVMKDDVAFDPLKVAFFGAEGVMFAPNGIAHYF